LEEIENIPHADASDKDIEALLSRLKTFKEEEFADLLHQCHNVIRNREKKDPVAAFDEIAKILFVKVYVERELKQRRQRKNLFTVDFLKDQIGDDPLDDLFQKTRKHYARDRIFEKDETINLKPATGLEIVKLLERYNLSDTSEDIKGIAFERFLGRTFRGEIGQFFTPRCIVEFMVRMVEPKEDDVICDPASGSGGFLIRFFEIVREQILADADRQYQKYKAQVDAKKGLPESRRAEALRKKYEENQRDLDKTIEGSRLWKLANRCIYGTDANDRMARTSKMNMIMHGDGHGGVHHHDGFLNVNGIFEGRFDIILTNPPFGANVEPSDVITEEQVARPENEEEYTRTFGSLYKEAQNRVRALKGKPIASLFQLPKRGNENSRGKLGKIKTEILFLERCLDLLQPGGRLGIVLPEGIFNNPSLAYVREFCEDRAYIRAVVSLPQDAFLASGASVKASLLFMQKFSTKEKVDFDKKKAAAALEVRANHKPEIEKEEARLNVEIETAKQTRDVARRKRAQDELRIFQREMEERIQTETRALLKERFPYLIFLYEAEKVGISSTGEADQNELFPNSGQPPGTENRTCLELFRAFRLNPPAFLEQ
jgi:type I restriction enzyme M protein